MTIINPLEPVNTLSGTYPNIVPFSIRENPSHTYMVETMRKWLADELVPFINNNINSLSESWVTETTRLIGEWETLSVALVSQVQNIADGVGDSVQLAQDAQNAAEVARDLAAMYASTVEGIQDTAITTIFNDVNSSFRQSLTGFVDGIITEDASDPGTFIIGSI